MPDRSLYLEDVHAWSEQQAALLRGLSRISPQLPNALDLENIVEEIESVGSEQRYAVESNLTRAVDHLLKVANKSGDLSERHWLAEIATFLRNARQRYRPSMRHLIDIEALWTDAAKAAREQARLLQEDEPSLPSASPFELADLLDAEADPRALADRLRAALPPVT